MQALVLYRQIPFIPTLRAHDRSGLLSKDLSVKSLRSLCMEIWSGLLQQNRVHCLMIAEHEVYSISVRPGDYLYTVCVFAAWLSLQKLPQMSIFQAIIASVLSLLSFATTALVSLVTTTRKGFEACGRFLAQPLSRKSMTVDIWTIDDAYDLSRFPRSQSRLTSSHGCEGQHPFPRTIALKYCHEPD